MNRLIWPRHSITRWPLWAVIVVLIIVVASDVVGAQSPSPSGIYFGDGRSRIYDGGSGDNHWILETTDRSRVLRRRLAFAEIGDITAVEFYNDAGLSTGIQLDFRHDSPSPAPGDELLRLSVYGENSAGRSVLYGRQRWVLRDIVANGSDAHLETYLRVNGRPVLMSRLDGSGLRLYRTEQVQGALELGSKAESKLRFDGTNTPFTITGDLQIKFRNFGGMAVGGPVGFNGQPPVLTPLAFPDVSQMILEDLRSEVERLLGALRAYGLID